jgi:photosystem I subunit 11
LGTACMSAYGSVTFGNKPETPGANPLSTARGWGDLTAGFFLGGMGGAFAAYFLLENFAGIDAIFRGLVN